MTYAIIEASGKQFWVQPGRFYDVDRLGVDPDETITIDTVLLVGGTDGSVQVGQPYVSDTVVNATVMSHIRGRKVLVYKMRPKKKTRKKQGHRQELTRIMIESIVVGDQTFTASKVDDELPQSEADVES